MSKFEPSGISVQEAETAMDKCQKADKCLWDGDDYDNMWTSGCGKYFILNEGPPTENGFKFCPFCGKGIRELSTLEGDQE